MKNYPRLTTTQYLIVSQTQIESIFSISNKLLHSSSNSNRKNYIDIIEPIALKDPEYLG